MRNFIIHVPCCHPSQPPGVARPGDGVTGAPLNVPALLTVAVAAAVVLLASACTSGSGPTTTPVFRVTDSYTAVLATVTGPATAPVAGTDGKYHVGYNILLQNASRIPATLGKVEVVEASAVGRVIATFTDKQLIDPTCHFGDCNRLHTLSGGVATDAVIPPQEARQLIVNYAFGSRADAPAYVMHHLFIQGAASPVTKDPVPVDYTVTPSHMHLHIMNGPSVLGSSGVPYVIDSFQYQGQVSVQQFWDADNYLSGNFFSADQRPPPQDRAHQMPLAWSILNFPD